MGLTSPSKRHLPQLGTLLLACIALSGCGLNQLGSPTQAPQPQQSTQLTPWNRLVQVNISEVSPQAGPVTISDIRTTLSYGGNSPQISTTANGLVMSQFYDGSYYEFNLSTKVQGLETCPITGVFTLAWADDPATGEVTYGIPSLTVSAFNLSTNTVNQLDLNFQQTASGNLNVCGAVLNFQLSTVAESP